MALTSCAKRKLLGSEFTTTKPSRVSLKVLILVFSPLFKAKVFFLCFPLTIPAAPMATRAVTTARALEPRPRSWTPVKAPRGTASGA